MAHISRRFQGIIPALILSVGTLEGATQLWFVKCSKSSFMVIELGFSVTNRKRTKERSGKEYIE